MAIRKSLTTVLCTAVYVFSCASAWAADRTFEINDEKNRDVVSFNSDAPIELIVGNTSKISGSIKLDESMDLSKPIEAKFDVDLATIDTGIPLRNEHMRDNFLETAKYPKATFVLKKLLSPPKKMKPGDKAKLKAVGEFTIHGKTVSKTIPIDLTYLTKCAATETKRPGCDFLQFKAVFPVALKDHDIKRPEIVFQKLADTVIVTVSATAYNQVGGASSKEADSKATGTKSKK